VTPEMAPWGSGDTIPNGNRCGYSHFPTSTRPPGEDRYGVPGTQDTTVVNQKFASRENNVNSVRVGQLLVFTRFSVANARGSVSASV
jgi:hypothetical protein